MKVWICALALLGYSVVALTGCASLSKNKDLSSPSALEPQAMLKFGDIPVPTGFKFLPKDSYSFESSGVRVGVLKYQGKANVDQVVNFYKEQMLMYNWSLLNVVEYGERMMNFDRDNETCIINIQPKGNNISMTVSVGPKSQVHKKSNKPLK
jgi:hypothetical protein